MFVAAGPCVGYDGASARDAVPRYRFSEFILSPRRRMLVRNGRKRPLTLNRTTSPVLRMDAIIMRFLTNYVIAQYNEEEMSSTTPP